MELTKQINEGFEALDAKLSEKVAKLEKYVDDGFRDLSQNQTGYKAAGGNLEGKASSGNAPFEAIASGLFEKRAEIANFTQGDKIKLELPESNILFKGAGDISTTSAQNYVDGGMGAASDTYPFSLANLFSVESAPSGGTGRIHYLRFDFDKTTGSAAEVAELAVKPSVAPTFTTIDQDGWVIAGVARFSNQSVQDRPVLLNQMKSLIGFQLQQQLDAILYNGSATGAAKFEGLKSLSVAYTGKDTYKLIDQISAVQEEFYKRGLVPTHVALTYADWLAIMTATNTQGTYLTANYLNMDPRTTTIRGLQVTISNSLEPGVALVADSNQLALVPATPIQAEVGYSGTDFETNAVRLRVEQRLYAKVYRTNALYTVTAGSKA